MAMKAGPMKLLRPLAFLLLLFPLAYGQKETEPPARVPLPPGRRRSI